ncbi:MAG: hypothetical protein OHK0011_06740 [Turneriella sp.]
MIVSSVFRLAGQAESSLPGTAGNGQAGKLSSPVAERLRQRNLSANARALERFFERNLPPGWYYFADERQVELRRRAPVYTLAVASEDYLTQSKYTLLQRARQEGKQHICSIQFGVERHDDNALMRQKLRLYQEIRRDMEKSYERLQLRRRCAGVSLQECQKAGGTTGSAAEEYLVTRSILAEKLEITPLYRIGTLYLFPQKNQCVTPQFDWYITNTEYPANVATFPLEAREEIEVILKNLEQIKLWE